MRRIQQPEVTRDRWGRPVIDGTTYLRPSSLAKTLEDQNGLIAWKARMTALGLSRNPDLLALVATTDPSNSKALNGIVERAAERAGSTGGRDTGTAIHAATEAVDYGEDISHMPADLQADALAYRAARESLGLTPLAAEVFVVNEVLGAAGTFDRLVQEFEPPDIINGFPPMPTAPPMITDIKTGSKDDPQYAARYSALSWSIQLAIYAYAQPHGATWDELGGPPSQDIGVVWYIPRGKRKCYPIHLDLEAGWHYAQTARTVYAARKASVVIDIDAEVYG